MLFPTSETAQSNRNINQAVTVKTAKVSSNRLQRDIEALGTALSFNSAQLVSSSNDYLVELHVAEGQLVKQGDLIARFNDTEERARLAELKVTLAEQSRQAARLKNLTKSQASALSLYDEQKAKVDATQAQIAALQARINELTIRAPFSGMLGLRQVSQGAYLSTGTVVTTIDDLHQIRVEFNVAERYLAQLRTEMPVSSQNVAYPGQVFKGQVTAIDPRVDPITRSVRVHAVIDNPTYLLRPGMLLKVAVTLGEADVIEIAEKAVLPLQSKSFVFVVNADDTVKQIEIEPGQRRPGFVEVVQGLANGDEIVIEGAQKLRTGVKITRTEF